MYELMDRKMTIPAFFLIIVLVAAAALSVIPIASADEVDADLIADGRDDPTPVGVILISNDNSTLYVLYNTTTTNYYLNETHLLVTESLPSGNPKVGQFDLPDGTRTGLEHDPVVQEYIYAINLDANGLVDGDEIYVAAHANVQEGTDPAPTWQETAWGDGDPFNLNNKKNWAMYINYTIQNVT